MRIERGEDAACVLFLAIYFNDENFRMWGAFLRVPSPRLCPSFHHTTRLLVHDGFQRWGSYTGQVQLFVQLLVQLADDRDVVPPDDVQPEHGLLHPA